MLEMLPPTTRLPPIAKISSFSCDALLDALSYLQRIYIPEVRGSRRRRISVPAVDCSGEEGNLVGLESPCTPFRSDAFERSYAIRWLTVLISQVDSWGHEVGREDIAVSTNGKSSVKLRELVLQEAASLLAICAGSAAAGTFTRIFKFPSVLLPAAIQIQLTDAPLENDDFSSVGAQTWGSACVLAELLVDNPETFGLLGEDGHSRAERLRVLELGAGTGLVALTLGKLLGALPEWSTRTATILATDFHPSVLANLQANVQTNFPTPSSPSRSQISLETHFLDWSKSSGELPPPFEEPFDLVLGADIIYEARHAVWIKACLERLLRRNSPGRTSNPYHLFHLVIPLRATHLSECNTVEELFPRAEELVFQSSGLGVASPLGILSKEIMSYDAHGDAGSGGFRSSEDVEYAYYTIGWCGCID